MKRASARDDQLLAKRNRVVDFYLLAKSVVMDEGFGDEIVWQNRVQFSHVSESIFLREAAWVVLSSGMKETVVRGRFPAFSVAFCDWTSARQILENAPKCREGALRIFGHYGKVDSIIEIAGLIDSAGFNVIKDRIAEDGITFLQSLPFIGPITSFHLAKNIGLDVVKPDRHLLRISALAGYPSPAELCRQISNAVGDRVSVVDLVVWRYATLNPGYVDFLAHYLH